MSVTHSDGSGFLRSQSHGGRIVRVESARRRDAIACLVSDGGISDPSRVQRFLEYAHENAVSLDRMWGRLGADDRLLESVLVVPNPGRTAMFFASPATDRASVRSIGEVIDHAVRELDPEHVQLAQTLIDPAEPRQREAFAAGGFEELAHLSYLERPLRKARHVPPPPSWPDGVELVAFRDALEPELRTILEQTYEDTLDCPNLRGLRKTEDILRGHRSTGQFEAGMWTLLRIDGRGVGALLLNPSPAHKSIELVYLGLAPHARGRGLGRKLLHHGLRQCAQRDERSINLAVDERNAPALKLYGNEGFHRAIRRIAMIRSLCPCECERA